MLILLTPWGQCGEFRDIFEKAKFQARAWLVNSLGSRRIFHMIIHFYLPVRKFDHIENGSETKANANTLMIINYPY